MLVVSNIFYLLWGGFFGDFLNMFTPYVILALTSSAFCAWKHMLCTWVRKTMTFGHHNLTVCSWIDVMVCVVFLPDCPLDSRNNEWHFRLLKRWWSSLHDTSSLLNPSSKMISQFDNPLLWRKEPALHCWGSKHNHDVQVLFPARAQIWQFFLLFQIIHGMVEEWPDKPCSRTLFVPEKP